MERKLVILTLALTMLGAAGHAQSGLQSALNGLGYSIDVETDVIPGELFFQTMSSDASIIFQESAWLLGEAMGWYDSEGGPHWLIGGPLTGLPKIAQLPVIGGSFGFALHTNLPDPASSVGIWYSQGELNADLADHVLVFPTEIDGVRVPYSYVLAWEDLDGLGDADYQDMVVRVTGVEAITPEPSPAQIVNLVQWKIEDGGNGHWYAVLASQLFWPQARDYVTTLTQGGVPGHLATITSVQENNFVFQKVTAGLHNPGILDEYFMGGYYDQGAWSWITHEPFIYTNWSPGEPNNDPTSDESRVSMWGPYIEGERVPGMWNNLPPTTYTFWSLVEWDAPTPIPPAFTVNGEIKVLDAGAFAGVSIDAYDDNGNILGTAISDANGFYELDLPSGIAATLELQIPLGFGPLTPASIHLPGGGIWTVPFLLTNQVTGKVADYWWWKRQLENIYAGILPVYGGLTVSDFNLLGQRIFEHFYLKEGGYAIAIEGLTFAGSPARAMTFEDFYGVFFDDDKNTNPAKTKRHLLAVLLNVASGRLSQLNVVSTDNANVSQAITHYTGLYASGWNDWTYWYHIMKIHCPSFGIIPAGIIPLTTPVILYKSDDFNRELPVTPILAQNYPNPFNPTTNISFSLPSASNYTLAIYNVSGQMVEEFNGRSEAGRVSRVWDGTKMASGVYLYRLTAGEFAETKKMILLK